MKEVTFKDRIPRNPGRVRLTPVAGEVNTFDLVRADNPSEVGTPLDKATFDSIIHNRLTGRYYEMTATKTDLTTSSGTTSPVPTSWTTTSTTAATSGSYSTEASSVRDSSVNPFKAFDGQSGTFWQSAPATSAWLQLNVPSGVTVDKIKLSFDQFESISTTTTLLGKKPGGDWVRLANIGHPSNSTATEHTIANPSDYTSYRLTFEFTETAEITVYEWQISGWRTTTMRYNYAISEGVPSQWEREQRIMVLVPNYSIAGVTQNTLNGVNINTILQPNKRYELRFNGSSFVAKEV